MKLVLQHNKFFVESPDSRILEEMLRDPIIRAARVLDGPGSPSGFEACSLPTPILIDPPHCTLADVAHVLCPHVHQLSLLHVTSVTAISPLGCLDLSGIAIVRMAIELLRGADST